LPHYALLHRFAARVMGPSVGGGGSWRSVGDSVRIEQSERAIEPRVAPPLPTETVTLARARQMVPNLLFDPIADDTRSTGWDYLSQSTAPSLAESG